VPISVTNDGCGCECDNSGCGGGCGGWSGWGGWGGLGRIFG